MSVIYNYNVLHAVIYSWEWATLQSNNRSYRLSIKATKGEFMIFITKTGRKVTEAHSGDRHLWMYFTQNTFSKTTAHSLAFTKSTNDKLPLSLWGTLAENEDGSLKGFPLGLQAGCHLTVTLRAASPLLTSPRVARGKLSSSRHQLLQQEQEYHHLQLKINHESREHVFCGRLTVSKLLIFSERSHLLSLGTWTNIFLYFQYLGHFKFNLKCEFCNFSFSAFSPTFLECLDFFWTLELLALFRLAREAKAWKLHRLHPEWVLEKKKAEHLPISLHQQRSVSLPARISPSASTKISLLTLPEPCL